MKLYLDHPGRSGRKLLDPPQADDALLVEVMEARVGELLQVGDYTYGVCILGGRTASEPSVYTWGFVEKVELKPEDDVEDTVNDDLECPFCGYVQRDSWELCDSDDDYECGKCGAIFSFTTETTRTFTACAVKRPEVRVIR